MYHVGILWNQIYNVHKLKNVSDCDLTKFYFLAIVWKTTVSSSVTLKLLSPKLSIFHEMCTGRLYSWWLICACWSRGCSHGGHSAGITGRKIIPNLRASTDGEHISAPIIIKLNLQGAVKWCLQRPENRLLTPKKSWWKYSVLGGGLLVNDKVRLL